MPRRNTHPFKRTLEGQQGMMSLFRSQRVLALLCLTFIALLNLVTAETICVWVWSLVTILTEPEKQVKFYGRQNFSPASCHGQFIMHKQGVFSLFFSFSCTSVQVPLKSHLLVFGDVASKTLIGTLTVSKSPINQTIETLTAARGKERENTTVFKFPLYCSSDKGLNKQNVTTICFDY